MPVIEMNRCRTFAACVASIAAVLLLMPGAAYADGERDNDEEHQPPTEGDSTGDGGIAAGATRDAMRVTFTPPAGGPEGALTSQVWSPPACYYAPVYSPNEMRGYWQERLRITGWPPEDRRLLEEAHDDFLDEFPDYHTDQQDEGTFWRVVRNQDFPIEERSVCDYKTFWVEFTEPLPPEDHMIDMEMLAELAWEETRVPELDVSLNPVGTDAQKVNLPMWVWLDENQFEPVSVRAELDDYGIWSETTATPSTLELDPGSADAEVFPTDGVCRLVNGSIGEPYAEGRAEDTPPCGVRYGRASHEAGSFTLAATLTWDVTWRDYQNAEPRPLESGVMEQTLEITVDEVQTIVRP